MAKKTTKKKAAPRRKKTEHTTQSIHIPEMPQHAHQNTKTKANRSYMITAILIIAGIAVVAMLMNSNEETDTTKTTNTISQDTTPTTQTQAPDTTAIKAEIFPQKGFKTKVIPGDVIPRLVQSGAIDLEKFKQLYSQRGGLTEEQLNFLTNSFLLKYFY